VRIAVVGGSGHIGRRLVDALVARGDDVVVLSRDPEQAARRGTHGTVVAWSPRDVDGLVSTLAGLDAVVNLAGIPVGPWPWTPWRRSAIRTSRIDPTNAIVDALTRMRADDRPRILVSASGTDRYEGQDTVAATEATPSSDGFLARLCLAWEAAALRAETLDVRVAIARIGFVLSPDARALDLFVLPFRLHLGGPIGSGRQWMSWVHIEDVVGLLMALVHDDAYRGPVNVVSPEPIREADLARGLGAVLRRRSWLGVPPLAVRLAMGEASILALGSRRIVPSRALDHGYVFRWTNLRAALADVLGRSVRD
jgi:uncharacterized protein